MLRSEKEACIDALAQVYLSSPGIVLVHYHGLSAAQVFNLRSKLRAQNSNMYVAKNTLAKIAATNIGCSDTAEMFKGPTAVAYSSSPIDVAKVIAEFAKTNNNLKVIGGIVDGRSISAKEVAYIATLPSIEVIRGQLAGVLQAPAAKIARLLQTPGTQVARALDAYANIEK